MAKPSPWRDFYDGDIPLWRHSSPFATRINLWRHPSPYVDTFPDLATGVAKARQPRELDHILHSVSTGTYAIQEMAGWRNQKGKSGSVTTLSSSKMAERASVFPQVAAEVFQLAKQKRLSRYLDVISAVLSHFGDPRRPSAIYIAVPQQLSRYGEASTCGMQAIAAHLAIPRPLRNRDFGCDSRRQSCAIGPLSWGHFSILAAKGTSSRVEKSKEGKHEWKLDTSSAIHIHIIPWNSVQSPPPIFLHNFPPPPQKKKKIRKLMAGDVYEYSKTVLP